MQIALCCRVEWLTLAFKHLVFPRKKGSHGSVMFRREVQCTPAAKTVRSFAGMLRLARRLYLALQIYYIHSTSISSIMLTLAFPSSLLRSHKWNGVTSCTRPVDGCQDVFPGGRNRFECGGHFEKAQINTCQNGFCMAVFVFVLHWFTYSSLFVCILYISSFSSLYFVVD